MLVEHLKKIGKVSINTFGDDNVVVGLRFESWGKHSGDTQTLGRLSSRFGSRCSGMSVYGHAGSAIGRA